MKNTIVKVTYLLSLFVVLACSDDSETTDDFTDPANLTGSIWESPGFPNTNVEYALLEFLSETRVQGSTKRQEEELQVDWNGTYEIVNDSIFIDYEIEALKGRITQPEIIFTTEDSVEIRFRRQ